MRTREASVALVLGYVIGQSAPALASEPEPSRGASDAPAAKALATTGAAEEPAPVEVDYSPERYFGVVFTALAYTGFGGGVRLGPDAFGVQATATAQNVVLWAGPQEGFDRGDYSGEFKFLGNGQINLDGYFGFALMNERLRLGGTVGFKHNTLLQNGFGAGFYAMFGMRPDIAMQLQLGAQYYPDGNANAIDAINRCDDVATDPEAPCGLVPLFDAGFQPGFSFGLVFFP